MSVNNFYFGYRTLWGMAGFGWLKNVARATWVTVNNLYVIPAHCLWMMILWPVTLLFGQDTYLRIEEYFFVRILGMVSFWNATAGYKIAESGDSIDEIFHSNRQVTVFALFVSIGFSFLQKLL